MLRVGLVALLVSACDRIILPFASFPEWSVIVNPLHLRLPHLGELWSASLGQDCVAVMLGTIVVAATSLATSLHALPLRRRLDDRTRMPAFAMRRHLSVSRLADEGGEP